MWVHICDDDLLVCDPAKIYLTFKFSFFESGTANSWKTTNSKPPRPIIVIGQLETGSGNQIIFIEVFSQR
jgi:hypothetical protein